MIRRFKDRVVYSLTHSSINTDYFLLSWYGERLIAPRQWLGIISPENWEPETRRYFAHAIQEGQTVIDVGASIGLYTILFSKLVGNQGRVIAFEPDPRMFKILAANIERLRLDNVSAYQQAVSNKCGETDFFISRSLGMSGFDPVGHLSEIITVPMISIDSLNLRRVNLIKIDIEGNEHLVLDGARETLERTNPKLIIEFLPQFGHSKELLERLRDWEIVGLDHNILCQNKWGAEE